MGKIVIETGNYNEPVGVKEGCGLCPSGCRTVCQRKNCVNLDIVEGEMDDFKLVPMNPDYGSFRKRKAESQE